MKRTLLFIACVLASLTMSAQEELVVEDVQNSGCLSKARGEQAEAESLPTIILTKEDSVLSVQVLNYQSNCATVDFNVKSNISGGSDGTPCSVNISVNPKISGDLLLACMCPYNVSFTVRDVEANSFYLNCWWYEGLVELVDGEPLILEDIWEYISIDNQKYQLRKALGKAMLADGTELKGEVRIPSELNYEGKVYSVTSIGKSAFRDNNKLTKVFIPRTIINMDLSNNVDINTNPFSGCTALKSIEVEEGNPAVCSADGVLFNKEKTILLSYPADAQRTSYTVPESVTSVGLLAFSYSQHLQNVSMSDEVTTLGGSVFYESKSLEEVRLSSRLTQLGNWLFANCPLLKSVTIPQGVISIGRNAFLGCTSLTSVTMPESVTSTDYSVFEGCTSLENVMLSPNLERIMNYMFADCYKLKELLIPDGVTEISSQAFKNCSSLKTLDLPESVYSLGSMVFAGCKLDNLYIRGIINTRWMNGEDIFRYMDTRTELYVQPSEVEKYKAIYKGPVYPLPEQTFVDAVKIDETTFPDENFRNWVLSQEYGADGVLTRGELENVDTLDISRLKIHDLKGIEYFTALKDLNCRTNKLTTLDLSKNTALEKLVCVGNNLTSLDVSGCAELDTLACSGNTLTALDVSKNTKLRRLECYSNQLTALDLSKNTALRRVHCNDNQLTTLDVSKNTALTLLECSNNLLTTLDVTKASALTSLSCMNNKLTTLFVSDNKSLERITCIGNRLTSLDVSGCSSLKSLVCNDNQLTTLSLSGCSELITLNCSNNHISTLDLSENTALTTLFCLQNQIKDIGMDELVENLPIVSEGSLNVMYFENEQNVMTTTQVAAAKAKGWTPYIWTYDHYKEYYGIDTAQDNYHPFIEEGKVWAVRVYPDGYGMVRDDYWTEYYYFDGDTIIGGQTCKQMKYITNADEENWVDGVFTPANRPQNWVGFFYEQDKKVYFAGNHRLQFELLYDFTLSSGDSIFSDDYTLVVNKLSGGIPGFKGTYYDLRLVLDDDVVERWLEGVGSDWWPWLSLPYGFAGSCGTLLFCSIGDEVIYYNSAFDDPFVMNARKRFDFTHTIKTQPKAPKKWTGARASSPAETDQSLYGEYNNLQLGINLDPLDDAYLVRITDETGKAVYEKSINAGNIVGLNIDISAYAAGRYTVTVDNSRESFTGVFEVQTSEIEENVNIEKSKDKSIYNLQGQRLSFLQKGLNIVNGQKLYVK